MHLYISRKRAVTQKFALVALRTGRWMAGSYGTAQQADSATINYVCRRYGFILSAVPKVATKSFKFLFMHNMHVFGPVDAVEAVPREVCPDEPFFRFSFVRNPWDRTLSCYKDKLFPATLKGLFILSRYPMLRPEMPFEEFVEFLASPEGSDLYADRHWISQSLLLSNGAGKKSVCDFIGKLENIESDFAAACRAVGTDFISLPHAHQSRGLAEDERHQRYNSRTRGLVSQRYEADIELFGYRY